MRLSRLRGQGDPAEGAEGVLQGPEEGFGILVQDRLAIGLAGEAQDDAKNPGAPLAAMDLRQWGTQTEVDLSLLAGLDLNAPDPLGFGGLEGTDEAFDGLVGTLEEEFAAQILEDALGGEAGLDLGTDPDGMRFTERKRPVGAGGRVGGTVWKRRLGVEVAADGVAMDAQITGDLADRATLGMKSEDCLLCLHREYIGHAGGNDSGFPGIYPPSSLSPRWYTLT